MLGKASEIKATGFLKGTAELEGFLQKNPDFIILQILLSTDGNIDYFYVIYKEDKPNE